MLNKVISLTLAVVFSAGQTWSATDHAAAKENRENCKQKCPKGKVGRGCKRNCNKEFPLK